MSRYGMDWAPYIPVAERRRKAEKLTAKLRKQGQALAPVVIEGRAIATTFWGKAWCSNLEATATTKAACHAAAAMRATVR